MQYIAKDPRCNIRGSLRLQTYNDHGMIYTSWSSLHQTKSARRGWPHTPGGSIPCGCFFIALSQWVKTSGQKFKAL